MKKWINYKLVLKKKNNTFKTNFEVKTTNSWNHMSITSFSDTIKKLNYPLLSGLRSFQNLNFINYNYNENSNFFFCSTISNLKQIRIKKVKYIKINKKKSFKFCKRFYKIFGKKEYIFEKNKIKRIKKRYYKRFLCYENYIKFFRKYRSNYKIKSVSVDIKKNINFTFWKNIYRNYLMLHRKKNAIKFFYEMPHYFKFWYKFFKIYKYYINFWYNKFCVNFFLKDSKKKRLFCQIIFIN